MVTVSPEKSAQRIDERFTAHGLALRDGRMAVVAFEGEKEVGYGLFSLVGTELTLLFVQYPKDDLYLCDLIARSVMNYGANRGAFDCLLGEKAPKSEFVAFGFIPDAETNTVNIIHTFTMCTHCKNSPKDEK